MVKKVSDINVDEDISAIQYKGMDYDAETSLHPSKWAKPRNLYLARISVSM